MASRPTVFRSSNTANHYADADRVKVSPWRRWYGLAAWRKKRDAQLAAEPLCRFCLAEGLTVAANTADHVIPHRGDWTLFWQGELQSLCATCHNSTKQAEERRPAP